METALNIAEESLSNKQHYLSSINIIPYALY